MTSKNENYKKLLRTLLNKVNKVTAPYRHGNKVTDRVMLELVDAQILVEKHIGILNGIAEKQCLNKPDDCDFFVKGECVLDNEACTEI